MTLIITLAILCAATLAYALHPLMTGPARKTGWGLMMGLTVVALGLYLMLGSPDIRSAPAWFEQSGPRHDMRLTAQRDAILQEFSQGDGVKTLSPE